MTPTTQVEYDSIILDCTAELKRFRGAVCDLDMPQIDVDLFLGHVLPSLMNDKGFEHKLAIVAYDCGKGEGIYAGLFENSEDELPNGVPQRVQKAVTTFGHEMKNKLHANNAYRNGIFAYELKEYINDATVVFSRKNLCRP